MSWPWSQLGLPGPSDLPEVRHAYAEKLKTTHPEDDPEGFQRLHSAYQLASRMARQRKRQTGGQSPESQAERPVPPPQPPEEREGFDFDRLLEDKEEDPRRPHSGDEDQDFDFDRLLQEEESPSRPPETEEQDFDFERLFAEGEAERAEARRRRGEERRRAQAQVRAWARERQRAQEWTQKREYWQRQEQQNNYDRERREQFSQEEERWQGTETILHTIEMMYNAQAGVEVWQRFFMSPLFQQHKGGLDLIFGLEDFVSAKNLSQEVRLALFTAYGFDKGVARPELRPLYQMLLPAWRAAGREKNRERSLVILGVALGLVLPFLLGPLLDWGLIPAFGVSLGIVWIIWVVRKIVITGNIGRNVSKKQERRSIIKGTVCVLGLVLLLSWVRTKPELDWRKLLPAGDPREQTCRYIEKDFGVKVGSLYNLSETYADEAHDNVFYLEGDPTNRRFLAGPDGERDIKNGKRGYTTNLPEMLLLWELKEFARAHKMEPVNSLDQDMEPWETSGTFLIVLPISEGEEIISELGELMDELRQEKWYKALATRCELVLCSAEMEEGRVVLIRIQPGLTVYSTAQCLDVYEETFAHSCCAQILKELELDRDFLGDGEERYSLTNEGMAQMKGDKCVKLYGLNEEGAVAMEYYINPKLRNIYCVPGNFWETGNAEEQIGFYRLLYWGDRGTFNLFYPWLRVD